MQRFSGSPAFFLFSRGVVMGDFAAVRERLRRELAGPGRRTLDLGCGPGTFADLFAGEDYVGVDARPGHVEYARRARPGAFLAGDPRRLELPDGRFDQAFSCGLLEHLEDGPARAVAAEAHRVLIPGGRFLVYAELPAGDRRGRLRQALLGRVSRGPEAYRRLLAGAGSVDRLEAFRSGLTDCLGVYVRKPLPATV